MGTENAMWISCRFQFQLYESGDFRICRYSYIDRPPGAKSNDFVAKGTDIPTIKGTTIRLFGSWETKKSKTSFAVTSFDMDRPSEEEGVIAYLQKLRCKIGKQRAKKLFDAFGAKIWDVIEKEPERLREVGLPKSVADKLMTRLKETELQRKVLRMFQGTSMNYEKAARLVAVYGEDTLGVLKTDPYRVCQLEGFSFRSIDPMALKQGMSPTSILRCRAAAVAVLENAAMDGHVCLPKEQVIDRMIQLLRFDRSSNKRDLCGAAIASGIQEKILGKTSEHVYERRRYIQEKSITKDIMRLMGARKEHIDDRKIDEIISCYESKTGLRLADSQKEAVRCVMDHQVSILTGGPGTGKTTTTKAILYCHREIWGDDSSPILLSPTGKAARRMTEATGYPASTIHAGVAWRPGNEAETEDGHDAMLEGNLILVDESSMADQYITYKLLRLVKTGSKLVFIGDPDQLPSVGCGNVLYEMIRSTVIPVVKLSVIFRQAQGDPIVENAMRIMAGRSDLFYAHNFVLMELSDLDAIFRRAANMYIQSVRKYGIGDVVLLCPYRKATDVNVNRFNLAIQNVLNPAKEGDPVMKGKTITLPTGQYTSVEFRKGDIVMMNVNTDFAKNGDTGYIRDIVYEVDPDDSSKYITVAKVEFNDDGQLVTLDADQMKGLDLAYCNTVHKSQGSEYKTVILVMTTAHKQMLQRNLFYTGITRAKENVLIVGETAAIAEAIRNVDTSKRCTLLADRLYAEAHRAARAS